ncbi:hypothetical protein ACH5RR_004190 [Cinchona calisaya]|uniref:RING-type E3 ubiquitin transferase n=1 Tax=Cinchona calisaya TaxID=153742 RepID=A0ABD3AXM8_9GENT
MSTTNAAAEILQQTTAYLSEVLSQSDLRHRIFSTFLQKLQPSEEITLKPLKLASETLENALTTTNPSIKSSSLRLAEKLLLSYPRNPFSTFLLSLIYSLFNRPIDAAISLFNIFQTNPSLARLEIAPNLFEELFLIHFLPILEWYNEQRSSILANVTRNLASGYDSDEQSVVVSPTRLLKNMSGNQALELKELERGYEDILDENCRVFAGYFREVLQSKDRDQLIDPPIVVLQMDESEKFDSQDDEKLKREYSMKNGRSKYGFAQASLNAHQDSPGRLFRFPIWVEEDQSVEFNSSGRGKNFSTFPSFYPERVPPDVLTNQGSTRNSQSSRNFNFDSELESFSNDNLSNCYSSESEAEEEEKIEKVAPFNSRASRQSQTRKAKQPKQAESSSYPDPLMEDNDNPPGAGKHTPPKDFVCPITTHIFDDPVTLETGQTYERKAIQEWIDRGNSTCPITRQKLQSTVLPKTNYVLKRLIASWQDLNPGTVPRQSETARSEKEPMVVPVIRSASPNCVISQATIEGKLSDLRVAISNLCTSEVLKESEMAVLQIEQFWLEFQLEMDIQNMMSKPAVINGFVEILFNSVDLRVLSATVFLLSELGLRDNSVIQTLTRVDSDVECIASLFKRGLLEAVVLVYLLRPSAMSLVEMDVVDPLLAVLETREENLLKMCVKPKTASVLLLGQLLKSDEEVQISEIARTLISENAIEGIVGSLEAELREEKISAIVILLRCMLEDGKCRNIIADKAELSPILESLVGANDGEFYEIVQFLSELVKLNRRTFNEQILHIIRDEGTFSTMHMLLIYLQTAPQEKCPVVSGLLLQLDLLVEPRKMSIYREEAIDALISCLKNSDCPSAQIAAAETIVSLQGRFSHAGEPLARAFLIKYAGVDRNKRMKKDQSGSISDDIQENVEEEQTAAEWEKKMAFVLVSHEFGLIFEALAAGLRSRYAELCSACFVAAIWLVHMLTVLPDTGVQGAARVCLMKHFVSIFKSSQDNEDKALSMLALNSFICDSEGLHDLTAYMKDILKGLRELKKSSALAVHMLKVLSEEHESSADLWNHKELLSEDCSINGEVLSIVCFKDKIFSGHSDGTIKVWAMKGGNIHLVQESQEHTKAVTSLAILQSVGRLYSGSLDRTVRVWSIDNKVMHCIQVHEMKDHVNNLVVSNSISCFIPQGAGIKVHSWNGVYKLLNPQKYVKCLILVQGKLYCGCHDNSIQEIDLATGTISTIQSGSRKLLSKASPIYAIQANDGFLYSASTPLDGAAVKIWSTLNYSMVGSLPSTSEVRSVAVSSDLIYLGCKGGLVEVWCKKKHSKVETLQAGTNAKVLSMALTSNEDVLLIGTSDGKVQTTLCVVVQGIMEISSDSLKTSQQVSRQKGGLITMPFIMANEAFERVASVGLHINMILYLTSEYHFDYATGAIILFWWAAISNFLPTLGAFLSDSYLGRFHVIALGTVVSLLGQVALWLTALFSEARPPHCQNYPDNCIEPKPAQLALLFSAFALMSLGAGGIRPCSIAFGADQFDNPDNPKNHRILQSFFNWYYATVAASAIIGIIVIVYIQTEFGWKLGFGVPVALMLVSTIMFFLGSKLYVMVDAKKSLMTGFAQVVAVAWKNKHLALPPKNSDGLYHHEKGSNLISPTERLRCLNKACIVRNVDERLKTDGSFSDPWNACTVEQVENFKALSKVLPMWSTGIMIAVTISQHSFPLLQAGTLDRRIIGNFNIPPAWLYVFAVLSMGLWVAVYDRVLVPTLTKYTTNKRDLSFEQRMGTGLFLSCMATAMAALVERSRRNRAINEGLVENPRGVVNMSVFWLVPQYCMTGLAEAFNAIGQIEFYYSHFPKSMASIGVALFALGMAVGNLVASLIVLIVDHASKRGGKISWVSNNLNKGHYDYYYWILCLLSLANFFYFVLLNMFCDCYGDEKFRDNDEGEGIKKKEEESVKSISNVF